MKILVALCVLAAGVNAQVGYSGRVNPDGVNEQFTPDYAKSIVLIGPAGYLTKDGKNIQFTREEAALQVGGPPPPPPQVYRGAFGSSGYATPGGVNVQFTAAEADNIVVIGPAGAVTKDGNNIQFTDEGVPRVKRALVGDAGIVDPTGRLYQLPHGVYVVSEGPSGVVLSNGQNYQYHAKP